MVHDNLVMDFLVLLSAHFLADLPLQGEWVATEKRNAFKTPLGTVCLLGHAFIQALIVSLVAGYMGYNFEMAFLLVGFTHFFIDLGKIRGVYGVFTDQILHYIILLMIIL